jgi:hypothetical protein
MDAVIDRRHRGMARPSGNAFDRIQKSIPSKVFPAPDLDQTSIWTLILAVFNLKTGKIFPVSLPEWRKRLRIRGKRLRLWDKTLLLWNKRLFLWGKNLFLWSKCLLFYA